LPAYRAAFFDKLAVACEGGLSVFAGQPLADESIAVADHLDIAHYVRAHNRNFLNPGSPLYQCWQPGILKWLEDWQPQALIVEANPRYRSTPGAVRWMHAHRRRVVGWGLGAPPLSGPLAAWRRLSRRSFLSALDGIIAYSQRGAEEYRLLGFSPQQVFVAPNAVVSRPERPPPERPAQFSDKPGVLFVGRLQARKRIDLLLRACAALPEPIQPHLWVVGDGPARGEFQSLAASIYPEAKFTGARHGTELEDYFRQADLFVLPGTGGLAVQQAMSFGLPVIVAEGDGTQDDLVRAENGWRIPPGDLPRLTGTLKTALSDPSRLRRMGEGSYRLVDEEVNVEKMVEAFIEAILQVLSKPANFSSPPQQAV
jgi:glycosyltransferase involved in cell wall biosynthesis